VLFSMLLGCFWLFQKTGAQNYTVFRFGQTGMVDNSQICGTGWAVT
jgi:hypothetical protein